MEKTSVFNLIILDESGSMSNCSKATVSGCNEVLNVARQLQKNNPDTQRCFVSIYAFQSGGPVCSRYLCKNAPVAEVRDITSDDYRPCGNTPLLDAVGSTIVDIDSVASTHEDSTGIIIIITDGLENDSRRYSYEKVRSLITSMREKGWTVNFIGANIDVEKEAERLGISNCMAYESTQEGTAKMMAGYCEDMMAFEQNRIAEEKYLTLPGKFKLRIGKAMKGGFFK